MLILTANVLGMVLLGSGMAQASSNEAARDVMIEWAKVAQEVAATKGADAISKRTRDLEEESREYNQKFMRLNGGSEASLAIVAHSLEGTDQPERRAAATILEFLQSLGNEDLDAQKYLDRRFVLAGQYVLDSDGETSTNAAKTFIDLKEGVEWNGWDQFRPKLLEALTSGRATNPKAIAEVFAFSSIPVAGSSSALYKLCHNADPETRLMARCALSRARLFVGDEVGQTFFAELESDTLARRRTGFADLESLGTIWWGSRVTSDVMDRIDKSHRLPYIWQRCTMVPGRKRPNPFAKDELTDPVQIRLVKVLAEALEGDDTAIHLSCARALLVIGKEVDWDLNAGSLIVRQHAGKAEIQALLLRAAKLVERHDAELAKRAKDLAISFDRPRSIF